MLINLRCSSSQNNNYKLLVFFIYVEKKVEEIRKIFFAQKTDQNLCRKELKHKILLQHERACDFMQFQTKFSLFLQHSHDQFKTH